MKRLFYLLLIAFIPISLIASGGHKVKDIKILGNQRINNQTIDSYIKLKSGQYVNDDALDLLVKELYKTNLFVDINAYIDQEQNLIIKVQENPIVNKVILKNGKFFYSEKQRLLEHVITLKPLSIFTETKLQSDLINLIAFYRNNGKVGVKVKHELVMLDDNRVDLIFRVEEGPTSKIKSVRFVGNQSFSEDDLMQVIKTHNRNIFSRLFTLNINQYLAINIQRLSNFYASKGYIEHYIQPIIEVSDTYNTYVTFLIDEGQQYLLGSSKVNITDEFYDLDIVKEISKFFEVEENQVFNEVKVSNTVEKITKYLNEKGYIFATVDPEYVKTNDIIDINYKISRANKTYVNKITIDGNDRTLDQVIRSKLDIAEGDPYNISTISKAYRNLMSTDFFSSVKVDRYKINEDTVNINLKVKEKSTGVLFMSGSTETMSWPPNICFKGGMKLPNLFGSGHEFSGDVEKSGNVSAVDLNLIVNNLNDSNTSLDLNLSYKDRKALNSDFSESQKGFLVGLSSRITENLINSMRYYYNDIYTYHDQSNNEKKRSNNNKENNDQVSAVGLTLEYNKLDNVRYPTDGYLLRLKEDISGLGGNTNFLKSEFLSFLARPVLKSIADDITFRFKVGVGYIFSYTDAKLSVAQHFFKGSNEIRGFDVSGIGPRNKEGQSLGGKFYFQATKQVDFPLPGFYEQTGLKGSLFVDYATLCSPDCGGDRCKDMEKDDKLVRVSLGFGFSIPSPLGKLRVDFGFPMRSESYDKKPSNNMRFSIEWGV